MYDYEIVGTDVPGASRTEVEPHLVEYEYLTVLASGADSLGGLWFEARDPGVVEWTLFKGTIGAGPSLTGPLQAQPAIPFSPSSPGVIVADQVKVYRAGWVDLGTTALIKDGNFLAPCALDSSLRWAVGGFQVGVSLLLSLAVHFENGLRQPWVSHNEVSANRNHVHDRE